METPDVTKAQLLALVQAVIATAVALGAPISATAQDRVMGLSAIVATAIVAADVVIRRGRQKHLGAGASVQTVLDVLDGLGVLDQTDPPPPIKPATSQLEKITAEAPPEAGEDQPVNPRGAL